MPGWAGNEWLMESNAGSVQRPVEATLDYDSNNAKRRNALRRYLATLLVTGLMAVIPVQAFWQAVYPPVAPDDAEMIRQLTRVEMTGKPVGTALAWNNSDTRNYGTVTLVDRFEKDGRECRTVQHFIQIRGEAKPWTGNVTLCLQPDGRWLIP